MSEDRVAPRTAHEDDILEGTAPMRKVQMSQTLFLQLGAESVTWGEPDAEGFYTPTIHTATWDKLGPAYARIAELEREAEAASLDSDELRKAVEALQSAITAGRKAMKEREADLTWCNKPDRCHEKAEGVTLAVDDFDEAVINALGEPGRALLSAGDKAEAPPKTHDSDGGDRG